MTMLKPRIPTASVFSVDAIDAGDVRVIVVAGELDVMTAPALARALRRAPAKPVVVDLLRCPFVDAAGLHVLLAHRDRPAGLAITCLPDGSAARLVELTVREGLSTFPTLDEAIDAVTG